MGRWYGTSTPGFERFYKVRNASPENGHMQEVIASENGRILVTSAYGLLIGLDGRKARPITRHISEKGGMTCRLKRIVRGTPAGDGAPNHIRDFMGRIL